MNLFGFHIHDWEESLYVDANDDGHNCRACLTCEKVQVMGFGEWMSIEELNRRLANQRARAKLAQEIVSGVRP